MTRPSFVDQGQGAYRKADEQLGIGPPPQGATPLGWLRGGSMPSLWFLARLQLALALLTFVVEGVSQVIGAIAVFDAGSSLGVSKSIGVQGLLNVLTVGIATAVLLAGAAVTSYLASRQDRERQSDFAVPDAATQSAAQPVQSPPNLDPGFPQQSKS